MKAVNIKGKDYITVNERLKHFRSEDVFTNWAIIETIEKLNDNEGVFKVEILNDHGNIMATAHAQEYRDSSYINKTSFLENGFTSALGRALGYLGIGIDASIATADEVTNAVNNQSNTQVDDNRAWLTEEQLQATLKGTKEQAIKVIGAFRMKKAYREQLKTKFSL
jgi:gluconate kinase